MTRDHRVWTLAPKPLVALASALLLAMAAATSAQAPDIDGRWEGAIAVTGIELDIAVEFTETGDTLTATIDIPQQGAFGLPLTAVSFEAPRVHFELPAGPGLAVFDGELMDDSIAGDFSQTGITGAFRLKRAPPGDEAEPGAAEASAEPPPYDSEEVEFEHAAIRLAGTLTLPPSGGPHPALVLITGSGPQNRDEELYGFRPFRLIADHLTRHGYAVLRYDDRGVGGSTGVLSEATAEDLADDALAAVAYLKGRPEIDTARIGLLGHSEGGIVAPLAATRSDDVAFLVLLAAPAVNGERILLAQGRAIGQAMGLSDSLLNEQSETQRLIFEAVRSGEGWKEVESRMKESFRSRVAAMPEEQRAAISDADTYIERSVAAQLAAVRAPWFRAFLDHDPAPALARVDVPVLAVYGELDLQVPPEQNLGPLEEALRRDDGHSVTTHVIPEANHLFQKARTGTPAEYPLLEKAFVPGFLDTLTAWLDRAR